MFVGFTFPKGKVEEIDVQVREGMGLSRSEWIRNVLLKELDRVGK